MSRVEPAATDRTAALAAVLARPGTRELWLRLARARPRTIDQIREIAPLRLDVVPALLELEAVGLVSVGREGLEVAHPAGVLAAAAAAGLRAHRADLGRVVDGIDPVSIAATAPDRVDVPVEVGRWARGDHRDWAAVVAAPVAGRVGVVCADLTGLASLPISRDRQILVPLRSLSGAVDRARALVQAGHEIRVPARDPGRLRVDPDRVTFGLDWGSALVSAIMRSGHPVLVQLMHQLWVRCWDRAVELPTDTGVGTVLRLAAAGFDDAAIGELMGVGRRTIQRRVAEVMDRAGVRSRFELGARWAEGSLNGVAGN